MVVYDINLDADFRVRHWTNLRDEAAAALRRCPFCLEATNVGFWMCPQCWHELPSEKAKFLSEVNFEGNDHDPFQILLKEVKEAITLCPKCERPLPYRHPDYICEECRWG